MDDFTPTTSVINQTFDPEFHITGEIYGAEEKVYDSCYVLLYVCVFSFCCHLVCVAIECFSVNTDLYNKDFLVWRYLLYMPLLRCLYEL